MTVPTRFALAAPAGLVIVPGQGTTQTDATTARYDFGTRRMSDESPLEHTFTLRNDGAAPLTIDRLQSSCGCTTAFFANDQSPPLTVGPGGIVPVQVSVAPHRLAPGPVNKSVWVFTHAAEDATTLLEITGTLLDDSETSPSEAPSPRVTPMVSVPLTGQPAPNFTQIDTRGKAFGLTTTRGRPVALFFFCGCPWCADVAKAWGHAQHGAQLPQSAQTLVVFAGSRSETQAFAAKNGLNLTQTILLPDPDSTLTERVYKLNSCPRIFTLDASGVIRYTNDHPDDQPRVASAKTIVNHTLLALGQNK